MTSPIPRVPLMRRARKAFLAAAGAAASAAIASLAAEVPRTNEGWVALVTGAIVAGAVVGFGTFQIRNEATVQGSDPPPAVRSHRAP